MSVELIIAAFSAALQATQIWLNTRDSLKTSRRAEVAFKRTRNAKLAVVQGGKLQSIVPPDILEGMIASVLGCWDVYKIFIDPDNGKSAREIDRATDALKLCLCEKLRRIRELNGTIPAGKLRIWWTQYCINN